MKSINFDEGYREYAVNGDKECIIRIRLTDPNILNRIKTAMKKTDELTMKYKGTPSGSKFSELDTEVRKIINDAFGTDICTPVLGDANVLSTTASGNFIILEFFKAFMPVLKEDIEAAAMTMKLKQPEVRPEVSKYLDPVTVAPISKPIAGMAKPYDDGLPDLGSLSPEQKKQLLQKLIS